MLTWADRMIEQGREEGALTAERDLLLRQLRARFGEVPQAATERIAQADHQTLGRLAEQVVLASTLDEFLAAL